MAHYTRKTPGGTSYHNVDFQATLSELKGKFPYSYEENNDVRDKTNFDFTLETESGKVFTLYDWKYYRPIKENEIIDWHIGAQDQATSLEALEELQAIFRK